MEVDETVVHNIAQLAQLKIDKGDVQAQMDSMSNILNLVEQMQEVDTTDIEPMANPLDAVQRLRPDKVSEPNQRDKFQEIAPLIQAGLYLVPKVIA